MKRLTIDLGLRRNFKWDFVIADVSTPIIGADFLQNFDLLVDVKREKLIDNTTRQEIHTLNTTNDPSIKTFYADPPFTAIVNEYKDITALNTKRRSTNATEHHIVLRHFHTDYQAIRSSTFSETNY